MSEQEEAHIIKNPRVNFEMVMGEDNYFIIQSYIPRTRKNRFKFWMFFKFFPFKLRRWDK